MKFIKIGVNNARGVADLEIYMDYFTLLGSCFENLNFCYSPQTALPSELRSQYSLHKSFLRDCYIFLNTF